MKYTNDHNIDLALAVWLLYDDYDYSSNPKTISATTLLQPLRSIILSIQHEVDASVDISKLIASRMGSALHESLEVKWKAPGLKEKLEALGLKGIANRIIVNPDPEELDNNPDLIPVYVENRTIRTVGDWSVTGKYDIVMAGQPQDYKSTSVWAWVFNSNEEQYKMQGSIYKWLNPTIITADTMKIHYMFTDWSKSLALQNKNYPQLRMLSKEYPLLGEADTDYYIKTKLNEIDRLIDAEQDELPRCTPKELWQSEAKWKYFKNPNATKATKNFDTEEAALERFNSDNGVGKVIEVPGEIKRCKYCNALSVCEQGQDYISEGLVNLD